MTSRQKRDAEHVKWFRNVYNEFLTDNKGCQNVIDYLHIQYDCDKDYWAKIARKAGLLVIKRDGVYFIKA